MTHLEKTRYLTMSCGRKAWPLTLRGMGKHLVAHCQCDEFTNVSSACTSEFHTTCVAEGLKRRNEPSWWETSLRLTQTLLAMVEMYNDDSSVHIMCYFELYERHVQTQRDSSCHRLALSSRRWLISNGPIPMLALLAIYM